jgi:hypothetical protein
LIRSAFIAPDPIGLLADFIFRAESFYAGLFTLFDYSQLLFFTKTLATPGDEA